MRLIPPCGWLMAGKELMGALKFSYYRFQFFVTRGERWQQDNKVEASSAPVPRDQGSAGPAQLPPRGRLWPLQEGQLCLDGPRL